MAEPAVRVIRSPRRKKTSAARVVDGVIEVRVPDWLSRRQTDEIVAELVAKVNRTTALEARGPDLVQRAHRLARTLDLPEPVSIRWVANQARRWGSCTPSTGQIRISSRLRNVPAYVLDYVIAHELAHLTEPNHGPRFKALEDRFPDRQRAEGFLEAMDLGFACDNMQDD